MAGSNSRPEVMSPRDDVLPIASDVATVMMVGTSCVVIDIIAGTYCAAGSEDFDLATVFDSGRDVDSTEDSGSEVVKSRVVTKFRVVPASLEKTALTETAVVFTAETTVVLMMDVVLTDFDFTVVFNGFVTDLVVLEV